MHRIVNKIGHWKRETGHSGDKTGYWNTERA